MDDCGNCHGDGVVMVCIDDLCHGAGECMHGDGYVVCSWCNGDGYGDSDDDDDLEGAGL